MPARELDAIAGRRAVERPMIDVTQARAAPSAVLAERLQGTGERE